MLIKIILRSPARHWNIAALARLFWIIAWVLYILRMTAALAVLIIIVQLVYPHQIARPFTRLDGRGVGFRSKSKLAALASMSGQEPYILALAGHNYRITPASIGITANANASAAQVLHYSLGRRLVPLSLVIHRGAASSKHIDTARLRAGLQKFAESRAQDPVNAAIIKNGKVYSGIKPAKLGHIVDTAQLQTDIGEAPFGDRIQVPRQAVQPAITEPMVEAVLAAWRAQTAKPLTLHAGTQAVVIPTGILQAWASISTNQKQDKVFVTYDQAAIKAWLSAYTGSVAVAPKPAVQHVQDDVITNTTDGSNGVALDPLGTVAAIIGALSSPARSTSVQVAPIAFTTQQVRSYSATSKGIQILINDWGAGHKGSSVAVSFQEIGGQGRSAALNDSQQFYTASIYKLFVEAYAYHLIEANQLSPNALVLGVGKSVETCLEATIVVSDNTCPQALGDQLGWLNIDAYAKQQGFKATSLTDHTWSTDTHDVMSYLSKLSDGSLMNAGDTAALLNKMQRQVYRSAIPAGSTGSAVSDKVGFYGSYWHDAAIVQSSKATYILVVFTNNSGPAAIKDLAAQIQQTINQ
jgi:beta-lactamase class A